jgi:hypothetical protein
VKRRIALAFVVVAIADLRTGVTTPTRRCFGVMPSWRSTIS